MRAYVLLLDDGVWSGYVWSVPFQQSMDQPGKYSCSSTAEQGQMSFPFPCLRLRVWSSETVSAVPSCAACSLSMLRLNLSLTHRISPDFRDNTHIIYKPPLGLSPKFIGSRNCVYRWRSLSRVHWHRTSIPQGSSRNECCLFRFYYGPIFCAPLFFHPQGENRGGGAGGSNRRRASLVALL